MRENEDKTDRCTFLRECVLENFQIVSGHVVRIRQSHGLIVEDTGEHA